MNTNYPLITQNLNPLSIGSALLRACSALSVSLLCAGSGLPVQSLEPAVVSWQKQSDGVKFKLQNGTLKLQVWTPGVVRVLFGPGQEVPNHKSVSVISSPQQVSWNVSESPQFILLSTGQIQVQVDRKTSAVRFLSLQGKPILTEAPDGRSLTSPSQNVASAFRIQQSFVLPVDEDIYGLGQHRLPTSQGNMSYRGTTVALEQANREVAIPFLTSSLGYGVLWDCPARTDVSVGAGEAKTVPTSQLLNEDGMSGGLTARYYKGNDFGELVATRIDKQVDFNWPDAPQAGLTHDYFSVRWTGYVQSQEAGDYTFVTTSDDGVRLWIDDKQVIDDWSNHAAREDSATVHFEANSRHKVRMEFFQDTRDAIARLAWSHGFTPKTVWTSEAATCIDYYFIAGPKLDTVLSEYRALTGQAPMPPRWAFGFWQSKERYGSQQEWLDIAREYRARKTPIDCLVQDFLYWEPYPWGSNAFDPKRYPDPAAAIARLHNEYNLRLMISVWGKFYPGYPDNPDANYDALKRLGFLYPPEPDNARYYDAFNPAARAAYWRFMHDQLFTKGIDAWWLDASEPEVDMRSFRNVQTALGPGALVLNAWPLFHTAGVYEGQRGNAPDQRVFILTRSAYAGQQRNAAATWSGDITGDWDTYARQIPAGLHFCLSGIPYWTTDIGGFFVNYPGGSENPEYRELFTRWFEWGTFCPIFRVHGTNTPKELWRFGPQFEPILVKYDNLRYRLMPYIYSQAWQVTAQAGTIMRALVMDFPFDVQARQSRDEFLFGPSLLVCPVTKKGATSRSVYLPKGTSWIDFWNGKRYEGGNTVTAPAPIDTMPLFVRAGSIIPIGPFLQHTSEKAADPIELRVYRGANGAFTLYEDQGDNYAYESGVHSTIPISWDENASTLTIGNRKGSFPGMLSKRTFRIVWVTPGAGTGLGASRKDDQVVSYTGKSVVIRFQKNIDLPR